MHQRPTPVDTTEGIEKSSPVSVPKVSLIPLSEAQAGAEVVVSEVVAGPPNGRCCELGLIPGAVVGVLQANDPMLLKLQSSRIAISKSCLKHILVEPI